MTLTPAELLVKAACPAARVIPASQEHDAHELMSLVYQCRAAALMFKERYGGDALDRLKEEESKRWQ